MNNKIILFLCLIVPLFIPSLGNASVSTSPESNTYNPDTLALYEGCKELSQEHSNEKSNYCRTVLGAALYSFGIAELNLYSHMDETHRNILNKYFTSKPTKLNKWPCTSMYSKSQWNPNKPEQLIFIAGRYVSMIDENQLLLTRDINSSLYSFLLNNKCE
jgi:hypothetical protein